MNYKFTKFLTTISLQEPTKLVTKSPHELLFGYDDVLLEATNGYFGDLFYPGVQFGYFLPQNQTSPEIIISTDTIDDFGTVKYFQGQHEVPFWPNKKDQQIRGSNGLIFSPLQNSTELFAFDPFLCKSVKYTQIESEQSFITNNMKFLLVLGLKLDFHST